MALRWGWPAARALGQRPLLPWAWISGGTGLTEVALQAERLGTVGGWAHGPPRSLIGVTQPRRRCAGAQGDFAALQRLWPLPSSSLPETSALCWDEQGCSLEAARRLVLDLKPWTLCTCYRLRAHPWRGGWQGVGHQWSRLALGRAGDCPDGLGGEDPGSGAVLTARAPSSQRWGRTACGSPRMPPPPCWSR